MAAPIDVVALISLEPWDEVWRRNQHLASALLDGGHVGEVIFVEPPAGGRGTPARRPRPGLEVLGPPLVAPRRLGGLALTAGWLRATSLRRATHLWVNHAPLGALCLGRRLTAVYDVTDDWRATEQPERVRTRLVRAEDRLAKEARTVVCSGTLRERWWSRYGVEAVLVPNAVDAAAWRDVTPRQLRGAGPHLGYVGTLHDERLDVDLVVAVATATQGTVHLIGPDHLIHESRSRLAAAGVDLVGPVPAADVPSWMTALDVLLCPHVVTDFTLSLDAIKAYEYAASGRPVVATPTSGFQGTDGPGLHVREDTPSFVATAIGLVAGGRPGGLPGVQETWSTRAAAFARVLAGDTADA